MTDEKKEVKKHPDFNEWIKSQEGQKCLTWPVGDTTYLQNRLFWAFDAGRNHVWQEYTEQKTELAEVKRFIQELNHSGNLSAVWKERIKRFIK